MIKLKDSLARTAQSARDARSEKIKQAISAVVEDIKDSITTNLHLSAQGGHNELRYKLHIKSWNKVAPYLCNLDNDAITEICDRASTEIIEWLYSTDLDLDVGDEQKTYISFVAKW
ncbi:hypothetical protein vBPMCPL1_0030 [Proteus phage vB_PMC-PL1]